MPTSSIWFGFEAAIAKCVETGKAEAPNDNVIQNLNLEQLTGADEVAGPVLVYVSPDATYD